MNRTVRAVSMTGWELPCCCVLHVLETGCGWRIWAAAGLLGDFGLFCIKL